MKLIRTAVSAAAAICALAAGVVACGPPAQASPAVPRYDHVVTVVLENHGRGQVLGSGQAPYLTSLARRGADFTHSYANHHPSQPNYLELFSGSDHGVTDDSCPHTLRSDNLAHQLIRSGRTFVGYSEGLPARGSTVCSSGRYARKHAPWVNFSDLSQRRVDRPYSAFPSDFRRLPTVSWVIPDLCHDMHDCSVATGDRWARNHLDRYARWARTHNSLLIVTFDEDDSVGANRIATFFVGAHIKPGRYGEHIDHDRVLRTEEAFYRLPGLGAARRRTPITDVFTSTRSAATAAPATRVVHLTAGGGWRILEDVNLR